MLAPYLRGLGYSGSQYGLAASVSVFSGALFTLLGGALSDRYGSRRILAVGLVLESAALLLIAEGSPPSVAAGFFLNGASNGLGFVAQQALVARSGRDEELHYTFSYVYAASTLGGGLGSFLGWLPVIASRRFGIPLMKAYRIALTASSLAPLAAVPASLRVEERLPKSAAGRYRLLRAAGRLSPRFYLVAVVNMVIGFGAAMSIHNIDYYFTAKYGVTSAALGSVFGLQQVAMAGLMALTPRLADRLGGELRVYLALSYSSIPLLVAMTLTHSFPLEAGMYLVRSILMNAANPLFNAFAMRLAPRELRGTASAFLSLSWTIPAGVGRAVGGWLLDLDLELPLRLTAIIYTTALTILALAFRGGLGSGGARTRG